MNLHCDRDAFSVMLSNISERTGVRIDIVEKDYYVTLMLYELASKQEEIPAYFKGGTALYKALKTLNRFSEDIDLTVEIKDCSKNQGKVRLEKVTNKYSSLKRTEDKSKETNTRGSITTVYDYVPITAVDVEDELQRFGSVKIEATSFTISEPFETSEIEPLLFTKATEEEKKILTEEFGVSSFEIKTIKQERIFADKILAAEFYYKRDKLLDVSKHLYDLTVMMKLPNIKELISNSDELIKMLSYKRQEEEERIGSDLADMPFEGFVIFDAMSNDELLETSFRKMQEIYVFNEKDMIAFNEMVESMSSLNDVLLTLDEGLSYRNRGPQLNMF